jgi:hypothetical protein
VQAFTLARVGGESAAVERLGELREARDAARDRADRLGSGAATEEIDLADQDPNPENL